MNAVNYTTARKNLAGMMDRVCQDCDTVIITKNNNCAVVMMPLSDYESLMETDYLLRNRANAAHASQWNQLRGDGQTGAIDKNVYWFLRARRSRSRTEPD